MWCALLFLASPALELALPSWRYRMASLQVLNERNLGTGQHGVLHPDGGGDPHPGSAAVGGRCSVLRWACSWRGNHWLPSPNGAIATVPAKI